MLLSLSNCWRGGLNFTHINVIKLREHKCDPRDLDAPPCRFLSVSVNIKSILIYLSLLKCEILLSLSLSLEWYTLVKVEVLNIGSRRTCWRNQVEHVMTFEAKEECNY